MRLSMNDPVMLVFGQIQVHDMSREKKELLTKMLRVILMDGTALQATDPIKYIYVTSDKWVPLLEKEFMDREVKSLYNFFNEIEILE